jgi:hypothetical protein
MKHLVTRRSAHARRHRSRGQGLVEFALVLPIFAVLVLSVLDVGRVVWALDDLGHAAREAARYASVHGANTLTVCPTGPGLTGSPATGCPTWTPDSKEPTRIQARSFLAAAGTGTTVYVCYYDSTACTNDTDQSGASNGRGEFVKVTVTTTVPLITTSLVGFTGFSLSTSAVVLINN